MRTDLTIKNATRIIIKRDASWRVDSRLYNIEVRWDYDNIFAKYCWNNERYPLPQAIATRMASVDTRMLAVACSRSGLMYKSRFEQDITNDVYIEVWRKDLRDNLEEQRRISLVNAMGVKSIKKPVNNLVKETSVTVKEKTISHEVIDSIIKAPVVTKDEVISISKVSHETGSDNVVDVNNVDVEVEEEEVVFDFFS